MTEKQLIEKYVRELKNSKNKQETFREILSKINDLIYEKSGEHISSEDKIKILEALRRSFTLLQESTEARKSFSEHREIICSATDNSEILKMLDRAESSLKGKR